MALRDKPKGRGDVRRSVAAGGFSQAVIPAKGEAREPETVLQPARNFEMDPGCRLSRGASGVTRGGPALHVAPPTMLSLGEPDAESAALYHRGFLCDGLGRATSQVAS